jgi:hypothetical protein
LQGNVESIILQGSNIQNIDGLKGLDSIGPTASSSNSISQIRITETQIPNLNAFRDIEISEMTGLDLEENTRLTDVSGLNRFAFQPGQNFIHINDNVRLCDETIYDFLYGSNWNGRYVNNGNPSYPDMSIRRNGTYGAMCPNNRPKVTFDLRWDTEHNDLNLHLKKINTGRTSDGYCGPHESCYWANCTTYDWQNRNWDFSDGSDGDPRMTADENCGLGPETIVIENIFYGDYRLGVQLWDLSWCPRSCSSLLPRTQCLAYAPDCGWDNGCVHAFASTTATIGIYVNGVLQEEYSRLMSADNDFWEVAEIRYRDGNGVDILPLNSYWNNWNCGLN